MGPFIAAAVALFASHAVLSAPGVRPTLIARLGRGGFQALHATVSTVALAAFIWAYASFDANRLLYAPLPQAGRAAVILMPLAFFLVVARLATRSGKGAEPLPPRGIYRITRHPGSVGLLIWAGLHLAATGDIKRVALFATMAAIALFAIVKNEWVLRRSPSPEARSFRLGSSVLPFGAVVDGRQRVRAREIGWRIPLLALFAYAAMLWVHPLLFGVNPLDWFHQEVPR
jgi:uncharacterized membrane protein